jgi:co-chaperonin GroES (HSP10)
MLRLMNDCILVRLDEIPAKSGSIFLTGADARRVRTGTVTQTGPGKRTKRGALVPMEVKVNDRVAFFRENLEHQQGKKVQAILGEFDGNIGLLKQPDVLFVFECEGDEEEPEFE